MADPKPEPMTDESIDSTVKFVETVELVAKALDMSVSQATRFILKSTQILLQRGQTVSLDFGKLVSTKEH